MYYDAERRMSIAQRQLVSTHWSITRLPSRLGWDWGPGGRISYTLRLIPAEDYVDVEMTIRNHTEFLWHDVFAFNCLNPILAPVFQDWKLERTYYGVIYIDYTF